MGASYQEFSKEHSFFNVSVCSGNYLLGEFVIQIPKWKLKIDLVNSQVYCNSNVYLEIILLQCEKFGTTLSFKFEKFRSTRALFFYEKCRSFHMTAMFNANLKFDHGYHTQKFAPPLILHFILGTVTENCHSSFDFLTHFFCFGTF